ncbi:flagellar M-ring protein FliF [Nocardioides daphniae]|uniref:Flagellar M-ring protein FliF n=1 Tax=Nocardioides daphniae TaxID=402297 RepID=A0A4P7UD59_9ACTN|nr:flagellar M-ring protein FliF [Nocardioides daphniae]
MKENATRLLTRVRESLAGINTGQKVIAGVGVRALLLAGFMVFRWVATPSYSPLYSQMSSEDAAAVIEELTAKGVPHKLSADGNSVLVPKEQVHETRIALSGEGLPANSSGDGYSLLDEQSLSTSQFQEQTSFKRAMEGELASTIEAIDGVNTAVVHLAMPAKQVFAKEQDPTTASVLVDTQAGKSFTPDQVQAVVHLVASSVDGLAPEKVTVADASGRVLSADAASGGLGAGTRAQAIQEYQDELNAKIQRTLDTVVGPGNSTVAVTADLDFDKSVSTSTTYESDPDAKPLSSNRQRETYTGPGAPGVGGVVGPEGNTELDGNGNGNGNYSKNSTTEDNAVNSVVERRESAPVASTRCTSVWRSTAAPRSRSATPTCGA